MRHVRVLVVDFIALNIRAKRLLYILKCVDKDKIGKIPMEVW